MIPRPLALAASFLLSVIAALALLALPAAAQAAGGDPIATFDLWWMVIGPILTLVFPFILRAGGGEVGRWFRFGLTTVLTVAVSAVVVYQSVDWTSQAITAEFLIATALAFFGAVQLSYKIIDAAVTSRTGAALNEQPLYVPHRGLGPTG